MQLRIHSTIEGSLVNGPGNRFVLWTQGCNNNCPNCYNKKLQEITGGKLVDVEELAYNIINSGLDGVTISGGEPFLQSRALFKLLQLLNESIEKFPNGIICFTGYPMWKIRKNSGMKKCIDLIDLIIAGRYIEKQRTLSCLSGSNNQKFIFLDKPGRGLDLIPDYTTQRTHQIEILIDDRSPYMILTGFPEIDKKKLKQYGIKIVE
jgi:anaerobic ribonucleoside-triphosphate reductase activating protein